MFKLEVELSKSKTSFRVRFPYNKECVEEIKETGSAKWNSKSKYWLLYPTEKGLKFLQDNDFTPKDHATVDLFEQSWIRLEQRNKYRPQRIELAHATEAPVVQHVMDQCHFVDGDGNPCQPRPYQWVPVHYAPLNNGNMLLLDAMGVGKTTQACMVTLREEYEEAPVLIVCPPSLVGNWQNELQKMFHLPSMIVTKPLTKLVKGIRYYIVSYFQMKKIQVDARWFLIVDEVHNFKNRDTVRYEELENLLEQKTYLMGLTGTPVPNRPKEAYPAMNMVEPGFCKWFDFAMTFCDGKRNGFGWDFNGASNLDSLHEWLFADFAVRREKSAVLSQLPPKTRQVINIEPDKEIEAPSVMAMFAESAHQKCKNKQFIEALDDTLLSIPKVIVFAHHKEMLNTIAERCKALGLKFIQIDGSTPTTKRFDLVQQFQTDPDINVAVLSITAAGEGLNITAAQAVVFAELYWVAAKIMQCEDRAHRPGVKHAVLCLYLLWGKREQEIHRMILRKAGISEQVLEGKHQGMDEEDMIKILAKEWGVTAGIR